jgi:hypothetical protein
LSQIFRTRLLNELIVQAKALRYLKFSYKVRPTHSNVDSKEKKHHSNIMLLEPAAA